MDPQLYEAPCGYFTLDSNGKIREANLTMQELAGSMDITGKHIHELFTTASRLYFQTFFLPIISEHRHIREMYLELKSGDEATIPVVLNAKFNRSYIACVIIPINTRNAYENEIVVARKQAEALSKEKTDDYDRLQVLMVENERKTQELMKLNELLKKQSSTDGLTGLYNRRYFVELAEKKLTRMQTSEHLSLLVIDIDHFKTINDTFGHSAGDEILQILSGILTKWAGEKQIVARMGGEEFVVALSDVESDRLYDYVDTLRQEVERFEWPYRNITISGGATMVQEGEPFEVLYARADRALYDAKNSGRNRVVVV